ncbi:DUF4190 domain-containing protein [Streptomyces sp. NPDC005526]|uniref:DUF4190 domain-containing protein n=1 Tax=Streptomyces sp. NPDC005526 TaxID=3156885 RepID=UPI0033B887FD
MTDGTRPGGGAGAEHNPWAPPENGPSLEKQPQQPAAGPWAPHQQGPVPAQGQQPPAQDGTPPAWPPAYGQPTRSGQPPYPPPSVHDQATMVSMPAAGTTPPDPSAFAAPGGESPIPPPPLAPSGPAAPGGYGYPAYPGYGWPGVPMAPQNGLGTAAMVLGILACCLFCLYGVVSVVLGILAIVFGVKGRRKADRGEATNPGQAQAGLITGIIGILLGIAMIVLVAIGITRAINDRHADSDPSYGAHRPTATALAAR